MLRPACKGAAGCIACYVVAVSLQDCVYWPFSHALGNTWGGRAWCFVFYLHSAVQCQHSQPHQTKLVYFLRSRAAFALLGYNNCVLCLSVSSLDVTLGLCGLSSFSRKAKDGAALKPAQRFVWPREEHGDMWLFLWLHQECQLWLCPSVWQYLSGPHVLLSFSMNPTFSVSKNFTHTKKSTVFCFAFGFWNTHRASWCSVRWNTNIHHKCLQHPGTLPGSCCTAVSRWY